MGVERLTFGGVNVCGACLRGEGGECHTPGCSFWMNRAPDIPFTLQPAAPLEDDAAVKRAVDALAMKWPDLFMGATAGAQLVAEAVLRAAGGQDVS
jgi:hypothetical protein